MKKDIATPNAFGSFSLFYHKSGWNLLVGEGLNPVLVKFDIQNPILYLSSKRGDHLKIFIPINNFTKDFFDFIEEYFKSFFQKHPSQDSPFAKGKNVFFNIPNNSLHYAFPDFYPHESVVLLPFTLTLSSITRFYLSKEGFSPKLKFFLFVLQTSLIAKQLLELNVDITGVFKEQFEFYQYHNTEFNIEGEMLEANFKQLNGFMEKNVSSVFSLPQDHPYKNYSDAVSEIFTNYGQVSTFEKLDFCLKVICYHLDISDVKKLVFRYIFYRAIQNLKIVEIK